ncbi:T9SS type A sorting domain-containing protein [Dyadobacter sp. LHD-138]|uniref:T9SS type A sorting domain-containing protein n=1 Tax=Dyadobacter sp. LHD-138 TaxID=3071413 RepID=UPI0027E1F8B5|nr:T9SS type A sorting domain-containing protein [Dyadobacter sp. LHD-138]MDQ6479996.1 T9SS type A sorting domain-containing protein [Dyadobacter sp. LHD-138]
MKHTLFIALLIVFSVKFQSNAQKPKPDPADTTKNAGPSTLIAAQSRLMGVIPSSPNVASLGKYIDTPISYYTGTPTISIPIYTVKNADIEVPISISYHGGGIRVEEEASQVGTGFALNAGGVIRRQIRGQDDLLSNGTTWKRLRELATSASGALCINLAQGGYGIFTANNIGSTTTPAGTELFNILSNMKSRVGFEPIVDSELDLFSYNVAGYSGKFVIEPLNTGSYAARTLSNDAVSITVTGGTPSAWNFILTFPNGAEYTFDQREIQKVYYPSDKRTIKSQNAVDYGSTPYTSGGTDHVGAWYLTKIKSAHRLATDVVTLSYTVGGYVGQLPTGTETYYINTATTPSDPNFRWKVTEVQSQEITLDQITFTNGKVKFFRSSRSDRPAGALKLDRIEVQTPGNAIIKKVEMLYDYFSSGSTSPDIVKKRLKLLSVQETTGTNPIPKYQMEYNAVNLPDKNSYQQDWWGFYNGATTNDTKGGDVKGTMLPSDAAVGPGNKLPTNIAGGADRNANAAYSVACMLTGITNPTGGKTVYNWQGNGYTNGSSQSNFPVKNVGDFLGTEEVTGPGTRISKIEYRDRDASVQKQTQVEYQEPGTSIKTGKLMTGVVFIEWVDQGVLYSSTSRHPMGGSLQGNLIGYSKVSAFNGASRLAEGYSYYNYQNLVEQADYTTFCMSWGSGGTAPVCSIQPTLYSPGSFNCSPYGNGAISTSKSVSESSMPNIVHDLNGSLLEETHFNAANKPVKSTVNLYESIRESLFSNYKVKETDGFTFGLSYQMERLWNRIKESKTLVYDQDGDINHFNQTVTEYTYGTTYPFPAKTVTTDSKSGAAKVPATIAGQSVQVYDRQIETTNVYPFDLADATSTAMTTANIVSEPVETTTKLGTVSGTTQTLTPLQYQKTTYNSSPFFLPQKIESKLGAAATAATDMEFLTYDARGNLLTYKERDGIVKKLEYYTVSDIGKTDLLKTQTVAEGSSIPQSTNYDYTPLVGLQGLTDPNAKTINYDYDDKSRIKTVKNPSGSARIAYCYNYAGQVVECATLAPTGSIAATDTVLLYDIPAIPLPVTLVEFEATRVEKTARLYWSTTAETNSDRFEIQRSKDGKQWFNLGSTPTQGESTALQHYTFTDKSPLPAENLYRLKMVDKDGTFAYSRIKSVSFDETGGVTLYPNPITIGEKLKLSTDHPDKISTIRIYDTTGQLVHESGHAAEINTAKLAQGLYMVQITYTDGSVNTHRVVKQ